MSGGRRIRRRLVSAAAARARQAAGCSSARCCEPCVASTASGSAISRRDSCAPSGRGCRSIASARPICGPRFRRRPTPRSKRFCAACGTILAAWRRVRPSRPPGRGRSLHAHFIDYDAGSIERFLGLRDDGKPALVFAAHLANWELPAVISAADGLDTAVLYRRPNLGAVADAVIALRVGIMGELVPDVHGRADSARPRARGQPPRRHAGRPALCERRRRHVLRPPLQGQSADRDAGPRNRVPDPRHARDPPRQRALPRRGQPRIPPVRDAEGNIDVPGTMQAITSVVEGWVREHPEQWLWLHRRWR